MSATRHAGLSGAGAVNAAAWLAWFAGAALVPMVSRNPLYLGLTLLVVLVVYLSTPRSGSLARAWRLVLLVGTTLATFSIGFNLLTVHSGDRVFARLPDALPIVGGPLTWNALVYGVTSALAIATLLLAAATLSSAVRQADLIRLLPSRVAALGVAGTVALTLVPQTIAAGRDIYDAQRARGYRFRSPRDATTLLVPLLGAGLERSLVLAEALETRGFGGGAAARPATRRWPALVGAALAAIAGLMAIGLGHLLPGVALMIVALVAAAASTPPPHRRTRYRPLAWGTSSFIVIAAALLATVVLGVGLVGGLLTYNPFPRLVAPPFDPWVGGAIMLLLTPTIWSGQ